MTVAIHVDQQRDTSCLGASEAAGVLGLDKWNPPIKVWRRLRGLSVDERKPDYMVEAAEWGQVLEPVIRGKYAVRNSASVLVPQASTVLDGWLRCTPDGLVMAVTHTVGVSEVDAWPLAGSDVTRIGGLVQCKNVDAHLEHEWRGDPPPRYEIQARVEMAVTGLPWCDLAALVGGNRYVQHRVGRDLDIELRILRNLGAFWDLVRAGIEPTVDHTDAWRLHVAERMPDAKMTAEASPDDRDAMIGFRMARAARKMAEATEALHRNEILLRMSACAVTAFSHPELGTLSAYRAKGGTWALRCPRSWGDE